MSTKSARASAGSWTPYLLIVPIVLFLIVFAGARVVDAVAGGSVQDTNPFLVRAPFGSSTSATSSAAEDATGDDRAVLERLAAVPTAVWLTPEALGPDQVGGYVDDVVDEARVANRTPVFVVYGIPDRDCSGEESAGGIAPEQYRDWVSQIADAAGRRSVVILEPDALATAQECDLVDDRTALLKDAVDELRSGPTVYIDAGHSHWVAPSDMAALLRASGVDQVRGFSTNVAGYESDADEAAYATELSGLLDGAHYVIDTGRNGLGSNGEWCNPDGRALGQAPTVSRRGAVDATLWIKPPGESDGTCGGAPEAGVFWTERALELARAAGW